MPVYKLMSPWIHTFSTKTGGKPVPRLNMCALTAAFGHPGVLVGKRRMQDQLNHIGESAEFAGKNAVGGNDI